MEATAEDSRAASQVVAVVLGARSVAERRSPDARLIARLAADRLEEIHSAQSARASIAADTIIIITAAGGISATESRITGRAITTAATRAAGSIAAT